MTRFLSLLAAVALLQGCVTADCEYLAFKAEPQTAAPLNYPAGVPEPTPSGEFRLPDNEGRISEDCLVLPPETLPQELRDEAGLDDDEEDDDSDE